MAAAIIGSASESGGRMRPCDSVSGRFELDCDTRQLLRDAREIHLSPKAFELLAILLANRPRAVVKSRVAGAAVAVDVRRGNEPRRPRRRDSHGRSATQRPGLSTCAPCTVSVTALSVRSVKAVPSPERAGSGTGACVVFDNRQTLLLEGANIIGRAPDATIVCDATGVSRHHARIVVSNGVATLEDLGSKNGTYLRRRAHHVRAAVRRRRNSSWHRPS